MSPPKAVSCERPIGVRPLARRPSTVIDCAARKGFAAMGRRLYVGNLPYKCTDEELTELFSRAGTVDNVRVMRDQARARPGLRVCRDDIGRRGAASYQRTAPVPDGRACPRRQRGPPEAGRRGGLWWRRWWPRWRRWLRRRGRAARTTLVAAAPPRGNRQTTKGTSSKPGALEPAPSGRNLWF